MVFQKVDDMGDARFQYHPRKLTGDPEHHLDLTSIQLALLCGGWRDRMREHRAAD